MLRDVYSGHLRLYGEHVNTCLVANNYASSLIDLRRFEEAKGVLRETIPMAQRVTGANHAVTFKILSIEYNHASVLHVCGTYM